MHGLALFDRLVGRLGQGLVGEERAGTDGATDPGELLIDHPPGTQVEVAYLGIAHLASRQADGGAGGIDQGVGKFPPEAVPDRRTGLGNGVGIRVLTVTPAVENDQDNRFGSLGHV